MPTARTVPPAAQIAPPAPEASVPDVVPDDVLGPPELPTNEVAALAEIDLETRALADGHLEPLQIRVEISDSSSATLSYCPWAGELPTQRLVVSYVTELGLDDTVGVVSNSKADGSACFHPTMIGSAIDFLDVWATWRNEWFGAFDPNDPLLFEYHDGPSAQRNLDTFGPLLSDGSALINRFPDGPLRGWAWADETDGSSRLLGIVCAPMEADYGLYDTSGERVRGGPDQVEGATGTDKLSLVVLTRSPDGAAWQISGADDEVWGSCSEQNYLGVAAQVFGRPFVVPDE